MRLRALDSGAAESMETISRDMMSWIRMDALVCIGDATSSVAAGPVTTRPDPTSLERGCNRCGRPSPPRRPCARRNQAGRSERRHRQQPAHTPDGSEHDLHAGDERALPKLVGQRVEAQAEPEVREPALSQARE